jgi:hypothetical protein
MASIGRIILYILEAIVAAVTNVLLRQQNVLHRLFHVLISHLHVLNILTEVTPIKKVSPLYSNLICSPAS